MRFGLFYEWPNPQLGDWQRQFEESIEQIQCAEELGFDFVLVAEHHFSNYGMSPAPLLQALAIAERTQRIKVGTAVLVLPIWPPLRLAEEVAVIDNLTDGRFFCGIGRGYQPHEFIRHGVTVEDSRDRFNECLEVLRLAWSQDTSFTYDGTYVKIPNEVVVWPKPKQKPHPPLWIAGRSAETLRLAGEQDMIPITSGFAGPTAIRDAAAGLLGFRRGVGKPTDTWELGAQTISLVCDSNEEAEANVRFARWQNRAGRALTRLAVKDGRVDPAPYEGEPDQSGIWQSLYYGNPERVTAKYRAIAEAGATFASAWIMAGGIEHAKIMHSIQLMGREVLPALEHVWPAPGLAEELLALDVAPDALASHGQAPSE